MMLSGPGRMTIPETAGTGIVPDPQILERFTVEYRSTP
jgi:hypothetical protein